jgi:hypothetical protein
MVSPATAFSIPWLIDLQALACAPQLALSAPSLVTNRIRAAAVFGSMQVNVNTAVTMAAVPTLSMAISFELLFARRGDRRTVPTQKRIPAARPWRAASMLVVSQQTSGTDVGLI